MEPEGDDEDESGTDDAAGTIQEAKGEQQVKAECYGLVCVVLRIAKEEQNEALREEEQGTGDVRARLSGHELAAQFPDDKEEGDAAENTLEGRAEVGDLGFRRSRKLLQADEAIVGLLMEPHGKRFAGMKPGSLWQILEEDNRITEKEMANSKQPEDGETDSADDCSCQYLGAHGYLLNGQRLTGKP